MIGALARAVKARMREMKFPHPIAYGPELLDRTGFEIGVVFERDREAGDPIGPPVGWQKAGAETRTADLLFARRVAGQVSVYVRSSKAGATAEEHENECDLVCDGVLCAMYRAVKGAGLLLEIQDSRLLPHDVVNEKGDRVLPGCSAMIRFRVAVPVRDVTYQGAGDLTGTIEHTHPPTVEADDFPDFDPVGA